MRVIVLALSLQVVVFLAPATAEGEVRTANPEPPAPAAATKHSIADGVKHYQLIQKVAKLLSQNKKDEHSSGSLSISPDEHQSDRRLGKSCSDKLDKCWSKLETCEAEANTPTFLFTQMGQTCKLKRKKGGDGKDRYEWSSKDMDDDTYVFSDRPYRIAYSILTLDFFKNFGGRFSKKTGGRPNGVMTFRHKDTDAFEGPLIAVYVDAAYQKGSGKYVYELSQSKDQREVNALDDFFLDGGVVEYESCSLFIDAVEEASYPYKESNYPYTGSP